MRMAKSIANVCIGACKNVTVSVFFISASGEKTERQKIDWRASLATDDQRELFDKLKDFGESIKELRNYPFIHS